MTRLSGWGRLPVVETEFVEPHHPSELRGLFADIEGVIARGNGRSYGDAALGLRRTVGFRALDRMRAFDPATGLLTLEAGVLLADVIAAFLPRGFFPPVVPGTRFVTVGGAIAADVHGKNHHRDGGFGAAVERFRLALPDGQEVEVSREAEPDLFRATVGGMGLTGAILDATIRLRPVETGWIRQTTVPAANLGEVIAALDAGDDATYSVAWIDTVARGSNLGRSLVFLGEHAGLDELSGDAERFPVPGAPRLKVPLDLPGFTLNRLSVGAFNGLYHRLGRRKRGASFLVPIGPYFFPLDGIADWNRIYGARGFAQHQCVLPAETAPGALEEILDLVTRHGRSSFLAVLKKLGDGHGLLSFPRKGYTLALDFPFSEDLEPLLARLDAITVRAGGRLYLAKDSRQSRETFDAGYQTADAFRALRRGIDPRGRIASHLSRRLAL